MQISLRIISNDGHGVGTHELIGAGLAYYSGTDIDLCDLCQRGKLLAVVVDEEDKPTTQNCSVVRKLMDETIEHNSTKAQHAAQENRIDALHNELLKETAEHGKTLKKLHETESELNKKTRDHAVAIGRLERAVNEISKLKENASISRPAGGTIRIKHDLWQVSEIASLGWDGDRIVSVLPKTSSPRMMYYFSGAMEAWAEYEIARQAFEKNLNAGLQTAENGEG